MMYTRLLVTGHLHHIDNVNEEQKTDSMYKGTMTLLVHFNIHFDHVVVVIIDWVKIKVMMMIMVVMVIVMIICWCDDNNDDGDDDDDDNVFILNMQQVKSSFTYFVSYFIAM